MVVDRERGPAPDAGEAADDAELAGRVKDGDAGALKELYARHGSACYGLARRIVVDATLAQDVVQEVFLALWHRSSHDPSRGAVRTWLLTITHHKSVDAVRREERRNSRQTTLDALDAVHDDAPGPHAEAMARLRAAEVRNALADLPDEQRQAVLLAYYGGYTQREISAMTGVPLGTVKTRTLAALRKLRNALPGMPESLPESQAHDPGRSA